MTPVVTEVPTHQQPKGKTDPGALYETHVNPDALVFVSVTGISKPSIENAWGEIISGLALFASAATTLTGFLILLLSPMPLFTMFGAIMAILIGLSLLSSLLLLPPLLLALGGFREKGTIQSAA